MIGNDADLIGDLTFESSDRQAISTWTSDSPHLNLNRVESRPQRRSFWHDKPLARSGFQVLAMLRTPSSVTITCSTMGILKSLPASTSSLVRARSCWLGNSVFDCFEMAVAATGRSFPESVKSLGDMASITLEQSTQGYTKTKALRDGGGSQCRLFPRVRSSPHATMWMNRESSSSRWSVSIPKSFRQRRRSEAGQWIRNIDGVRRVLHGLPEVIAAQSAVVCEGEKDVDNPRPHLPPDRAPLRPRRGLACHGRCGSRGQPRRNA